MASRRRIKLHRIYTVDEVAKTLDVVKPTVRRWIKSGGLPALTDRRPWLVQGADLNDFLRAARTQRQTCEPDECYCVKCRKPQRPAGAFAEFIPLTPTGGNLRAICPACETLMHKRVSRAALQGLRAILDISIALEPSRLTDRDASSPNVNLK